MEKKFHYRDEHVAQQPTPDYKICLLGEVGVGKTCFFCTVGLGKFPTEYIPSVFDLFTIPIDLPTTKETKYATIWELAYGSFDERSRAVAYPMSDCFIFAYTVDKRDSFDKIFSQWIPESDKDAMLPEKEAKKTSIGAGAYSHLECSALRGIGVKEVLQAAAMSIEDPSSIQKEKIRCKIQ